MGRNDPVSFEPKNKIMLVNSVSDQNVYFTYICSLNDIKGNNVKNNESNKPSHHNICKLEDVEIDNDVEAIQVEKAKALHELVESQKQAQTNCIEKKENKIDFATPGPAMNSGCENEEDEFAFLCCDNPNILTLTKMKWLTEDKDGAPDSSSSSLSPASSLSSNFSQDSDENLNKCLSDRCLSTILRLDKEHNMFGLSNIAIDLTKPSRKIRKQDEKAVFHQTAIVQICCGTECCKYRSNTDLPSSLKCGGCRGCCIDPTCPICVGPCRTPCADISPCPPLCVSFPSGKCNCKLPCPPSKCLIGCSTCFGLKISLNRKPTYEPSPIQLTPRSSCVLQKPLAARSCHHLPHCIPPSSCFPYLMPCFWPARASAPCNTPARCFHNPPCLPPRKRKSIIPPEESCVKAGKYENGAKQIKCPNMSCPGNSDVFRKEIEERFGKQQNS